MSKERRLSDEEVVDAFMEHADVIAALRSWANNHISGNELLERLVYIQEFIDSNPVAIEADEEIWESA